jgi:hypothetical protein
VPEYRVTLKSSAVKEFFRISEPISARIFPKIKALAQIPDPKAARSYGSDKMRGVSALEIIALSTPSMTKRQ